MRTVNCERVFDSRATTSSSKIHSISKRNTLTGHCAPSVSRSTSSLQSQHLTTMDTVYGVNACHVKQQLKRNGVEDMTLRPMDPHFLFEVGLNLRMIRPSPV